MKKVPVYILLFLYTAVQLKPLTAVVQDALAHTFWKVQHMATVHYENGRYHLHAELQDFSEKENKTAQQKTPSSEKSIENTAQELPHFNFDFANSGTAVPFHILQTQALASGHTQINSPPPKVA